MVDNDVLDETETETRLKEANVLIFFLFQHKGKESARESWL